MKTMKTFKSMLLTMLLLSGSVAFAQSNVCEGQGTQAAEGSFNLGYNYTFTTVGTDVVVEFQLLDPQVGLVAFAQTFNPNFEELPMDPVGDPSAQTFGITFPDQTPGEDFNMRCKFAFAGGLSTTAVITYVVDEGCAEGPAPSDISLPITFEDTEIDYELQDFEGTSSQIITDPEDPGNLVVETVKSEAAAFFAGTTVADVSGFSEPIPFEAGSTRMTVRVWSPTAGIPVRLKVENVADPTVSVETEATTEVAEAWDTLTFNFANQSPGTAALNFGATYNKATIFFNFGTTGAEDGEQTYYWDDVDFLPGDPLTLIDLPIDFEDPELDYGFLDFGGNVSSIAVDPLDAGNTVAQSVRTENAEFFAGTSLGGGNGLANPVPFAPGSTKLSMRVLSPEAGVTVRMKIENAANPAISVETDAETTVSGAWETLEFDFSNEVDGTAPINFVNVYNQPTVFFNFGLAGGPEQIYYWDDIEFIPGDPVPPLAFPVDFENDFINYGLVDFAGTASSRVTDPTDANNTVVQTIRGAGSAVFAGTLLGEGVGFAEPFPFDEDNTTITVRVWAPEAGTPVRLKAEALTNPGIFVETETVTTVAEEWETLTFDFSDQVEGTPAVDFDNDYEKLVIFFNFGTDGGTAGEQTYFWDDVEFSEEAECLANGGTLTALSPVSVCVGTGEPQGVNIQLTGAVGQFGRYGLLDTDNNVLDVRAGNANFNLDVYPPGQYRIRHLRYEADVDAAQLASLTNASQLAGVEGCWASSNTVNVFLSTEPEGGTLTATSPTTVCAASGSQTVITTELTGASGFGSRFFLVNLSAPGNPVLANNSSGDFNLNAYGPGTYQVRHLSYQQGVSLTGIESAADLKGCFDISNGVNVSIVNCGAALSSSPNPTAAQSYVTFSNPGGEYTTLEVYDMSGRMVERIFSQVTVPGKEYRLEFDGAGLPNGVYLYRLTTESETVIDKFMITR